MSNDCSCSNQQRLFGGDLGHWFSAVAVVNCLSSWVFSNRSPAVFVDVVGVALAVEVLVFAAQGVVELESL